MATQIKLPKVAQYVKNVGKSVAFATIDTITDNTTGIKDFIDTNNDIFKDVYSSVKNYRNTIKAAEKSIKQSNVYQAVELGIKNLIEDAKSGNFYNDRTSEYGEDILGLDDFDYEGGDVTFSEKDSNAKLADSFNAAIGAAATSQNTIVAQSTSAMVQSNKASTKMLMAHMDKTTAAMTSSIGTVYSALSVTNAFLQGPMAAHLENSKRYYEETLKIHTENNGLLKELLEMQRNLYKREAQRDKDSHLDQSMRFDGSADFRGYAKAVKSNIADIMDSFGLSALKMDMGGGNPYLVYAAAPFKMILGPIMQNLLSKDFKKALKSFDKGVTTMFSQFVARMNTARDEDDGSFMSILGRLFGIKVNRKDGIDASKYEKGSVPFDGIVRQSIIETIPGYLARIEAALTGGAERHYDFQKGTWKSAKPIQREYDQDRISAIMNSNYNAMHELQSKYVDPLNRKADDKDIDAKTKKALKSEADRLTGVFRGFFDQLFEEGGDFKSRKKDAHKHYKMSKKDFALIMSLPPELIREFAANNMGGMEELARLRASQERNGGVQRHLYNGAYDNSGEGRGGRHNPSDFVMGGKGLLANSTDKAGRNIFWYLNEIISFQRAKSSSNTADSSAPRGPRGRGRKTRKARVKTSSSRTSDDGDPDGFADPDIADSVWAETEEKIRKEEAERMKKSSLKDKVEEKFGTSSIIAKVVGGASEMLNKPMKFMTKMLEKADKSMFKLMFGTQELKDSKGKPIESVFDAIIKKVDDAFDWIKSKFKEGFDKWLKPLWEKFGKPKYDQYVKPFVDSVKQNLKGYGKAAIGQVKGAFEATGITGAIENASTKIKRHGAASSYISSFANDIGLTGDDRSKAITSLRDRTMTVAEYKKLEHERRIAERIKRGEVVGANEFKNSAAAQKYDKENPGKANIKTSAFGRYVTKRGLTMISPGEMIIPASFDKNEQRKMLALEKRDRSRIANYIGLNAEGTVNTEEMKSNLRKIYEENKGVAQAGKVGAGGILGAGLLTGFNPLLGAMAGAGLSILSNSDTLKNMVFGKEMEDGSREGGIISKKFQDTFKKYAPDMKNFGIVGGILGLVTPFGPLGGAALGAGIGLLKNSEGFKKFIFGDADTGEDGLISPESKEKMQKFMKKAAPAAAIGAVAGVMAGPFGFLGNAVLGTGLGLLASTDTFHEFLFGNKEKGTNGLFGAINKGIFDPAKEKIGEILESFKGYVKKNIFDPMKNFWKPFQQMLKNTISNVGNGVKDFLNDMFERTLGIPIADFLQEKLFKPITKTIFTVLKAPIAVGKAIVAAPFRALGGIGNSMRMSQIRKGSAHDMSASERLAWREQHQGRSKFRRIIGGKDKMLQQDEMLAGMTDEQIESLYKNSKASISSLEELQKAKGQARKDVGNDISNFFNEKVDGKTRYSRVNYKKVKKMTDEILEKGDVDFAKKKIFALEGLSKEEKQSLFDKVSDQMARVKDTTDVYDKAKGDMGDVDKELTQLLGHKVKNRKQRRQLMRTAEAELKARRKAARTSAEKDGPSETAEEATDKFRAKYEEKSQRIIEIIEGIAKSLSGETVAASATSSSTEKADNKAASDTTGTTISSTGTPLLLPAKAESLHNTQASAAMEDIYSHSQDAKNIDAVNLMDFASPKKKQNKFKNFIGGLFGKKHNEDSKEATDARKAEAAEKADEQSANDAERKSVGILERIATGLGMGKKKDKKKEGQGLLSKIGSGLSSVFGMLGGAMPTWAKTGLGVLGIAGGVSLLGHFSKWAKEKAFPKLKEIFFGTDTNGDGVADTEGLFGKIKGLLCSDPNSPISKVFNWFSEQGNLIQKRGGIGQYFAQDVLPNVMDKFLTGWGYAMENIVSPLVTVILKNLPAMLASLGKALIKGIGAAIFNKKIKRDEVGSEDLGDYTGDASAQHSKANSALSGYVSSEVKTAYSGLGMGGGSEGGASTSVTWDWTKMSDPNYIAADKTYDAYGNKLNKDSIDVMYKKAPGIAGIFGAKQSTNQMVYDENGNIAISEYDTYNTTDSLGSKAAKAANRAFLLGLGGKTVGIGKALGKVKGKGVGKGYLKAITGGVGKGVKYTGKALDGANTLGGKLNKFIMNSKATTDAWSQMADDIVAASGGTYKKKDVMKLIQKKGVTGAGIDLVKGTDDKALKHVIFESGKNANATIKGLAGEATEEVAENVAKKGATKVSKKGASKIIGQVGDKLADTSAGKAVKKVAGKVDDVVKNNKVVQTVTKVADGAKGMIAKISSKVVAFFKEIASNSKILGFLEKACKKGAGGKKAIGEALEKIGTKLANTVIGKAAKGALTKIASAVAKYIPYLNIAMYVLDFLHGYNNADTILGVAKGDEYKVGFGQKCLCGLLNLVTANITLGLVPNDLVVDVIVEYLFPLFGLDATELNAARDRADNILDEWNKAHPEETYTNLEDFNNKDKILTKLKKGIGKAATKAWGGIKNVAGKAWGGIKKGASAVGKGAKKAWNAVKESGLGKGVKSAADDVKSVMKGEKTIFSKDYWAIEDDPENPMGTLGKVFATISKVIAAPKAMLGYVVSKAIQGIKKMVGGLKEGIGDASEDVKAVVKGEYTVFSKKYWKTNEEEDEENPMSGLGKVISMISKVLAAPKAMIGWTVSKVIDGFKVAIKGLKEGIVDSSTDVLAVAKGKYTVFNKKYWRLEAADTGEPISKLGIAIATISRLVNAPKAMIGWTVSKVIDGFKFMIKKAKEGGLDAKKDIDAVKKGEYTIFNKKYWKSNEDDPENPISGLGNVFGMVSRVIQAPTAMLGWTGSKIIAIFKKLVSGMKEGTLDAKTDVDAVKQGKYTIFNRKYWNNENADKENPISTLGSIFGFVSRVTQAPIAMLGWTGTKIKNIFKTLVNGMKEGVLDATTDVNAVKNGEYTIFNKDYWKSDNDDGDNPMSKLGSIFGFVSRVAQAPMAMLGWVGTKIKAVFQKLVSGMKEGVLDASSDVNAVKRGEYTIFNKNYWKSDNDDGDNPMSKLGSIFGFVSRVSQAPMAMLGWVGTKVKAVFKALIDGAKEGALDASSDVDAVKKGEYTVFNKKYWTSDNEDDDNPMSKLGSVFGFVTRLTQAPMAMFGYVVTKVKSFFTNIIDGVKDVQADTDKVIKKAEDGDISVFSKEYWKMEKDDDNPLGVFAGVVGFIQRLSMAPVIVIKSVFKKIKDTLGAVWDWFKGLIGLDDVNISDGEKRAAEGRFRQKYGMGHAYQSDIFVSGMKYGDSTIKKSGCAPVAATNLINNINPNSMTVQQAAAFAEQNGMTVKGGGTDIRYFNTFLGSQGIGTKNTKDKNAILKALKQGNQVIMLGQDSHNGPGAPFGTNPHFVTARGIDKMGNIIVEDPDLAQSSVTYKKDALLNSMTTSIITDGRRRMSDKLNKHGLGRLWGGDGDETDSTENEPSISNLMSSLGDVGTNFMKKAYGSVYDALFGSEDGSTDSSSGTTTSTGSVNLSGNSDAEKIWNFLRERGFSAAGAAGIMGNLYAESGLKPNNLQGSYESKYGSDEQYTNAVNNKSKSRDAFGNDSAGYGLAQWTYHSRKKGLYDATVAKGLSIADLGGQLGYLDSELSKYKELYDYLKTTSDYNTASDRMCKEFERPAVNNLDARRGYTKSAYDQFSGSGRATTGIAASGLNRYSGSGRYYAPAQYYGGAGSAQQNVDYVTFLQTIITVLMNIANNTAILEKILSTLSEYFNIQIDKSEIQAATAASNAQTAANLKDLIQRSGGDGGSVAKLLNSKDTDYLVSAMTSLAKE